MLRSKVLMKIFYEGLVPYLRNYEVYYVYRKGYKAYEVIIKHIFM